MTRNRTSENNRRRQSMRTRVEAEVRPGEKLIGFYSHDCAGCSCEATHHLNSVPCISVGRANGRDRCLGCGTSWPQMERRGVAA